MRIDVSPLDFIRIDQDTIRPSDPELWKSAQDFASRELADKLDVTRLAKAWVSHENGVVTGITGYVMRPDIVVFRVAGDNAARSTKMLTDRLQAYFADNGLRGNYVLLHISDKETPEQRCHRWEESLEAAGATPADRLMVEVR